MWIRVTRIKFWTQGCAIRSPSSKAADNSSLMTSKMRKTDAAKTKTLRLNEFLVHLKRIWVKNYGHSSQCLWFINTKLKVLLNPKLVSLCMKGVSPADGMAAESRSRSIAINRKDFISLHFTAALQLERRSERKVFVNILHVWADQCQQRRIQNNKGDQNKRGLTHNLIMWRSLKISAISVSFLELYTSKYSNNVSIKGSRIIGLKMLSDC